MIKRILFVGHNSEAGGAEDDFERLLKYFSRQKDKYCVHALYPEGPRESKYADYCEKYFTYRWGYLPTVYNSLWDYFKYLLKFFIQYFQIKNKTAGEKYDLCVLNVSALLWPALILKRKNYKVVVFLRELIEPYSCRKYAYKILNRYCDYFIAISQSVCSEFKEITGAENIDVVRTSVESGMHPSDSMNLKTHLGTEIFNKLQAPECFKIVSIGSICKNKNQLLLVNSLGLLSDKDVLVFFAGKDFENDKYVNKVKRSILKYNLSSNCYFLGNIAKDILFGVLDKSDAVAITSLTEGFSIVMLEGFYFKKPVISTRVADIDNIIENKVNGLLVDYSTESLAHAINYLKSDTLRAREIGKKGYKTFQLINNLEYNLRRTEEIFIKVSE